MTSAAHDFDNSMYEVLETTLTLEDYLYEDAYLYEDHTDDWLMPDVYDYEVGDQEWAARWTALFDRLVELDVIDEMLDRNITLHEMERIAGYLG